jgi:hypothetical protein
MRDLLSKVMTGSMIAGAALLVVACGKSDEATNNAASYNVEDATLANDGATVDMNGTGTTGTTDVAGANNTSDVAGGNGTSDTTSNTGTSTNGM